MEIQSASARIRSARTSPRDPRGTRTAASSSASDDDDEEIRPKLTPNQTNRKFYEERILNGSNIDSLRDAAKSRKEDKSNRLMAQAYLFFRDRIKEMVGSGKGVSAICKDLCTAVDARLQVIKISVADDYDAYLLFETLNDRGLALSVSDLVKNHIFSRADDRLTDVQENWEKMQGHLQSIETKRFLRHLWLSESGVVRDKDLFKKIKENYNDKKSVYLLSKNLKNNAEYYASLSDADSELWSMFDPMPRSIISKNIRTLNLLGVNQYNPLLLSALSNAPDLFSDILNLVVTFAFRYSIIGAGGTGNIERAFSDAATHLRSKPNSTIEEIFGKVTQLYPKKEQFIADFSGKKIPQSAIARYILRAINDHSDQSGKIVNPDSYTVNLEHVLPKKFKEEDWEVFRDGEDIEIEDYIDRLGNMTLLKGALNIQSSNKSFAEKKSRYLDHEPLRVAEYVYAQETWTYRNVDENQRLMAELAAEIWDLPYS